jgi:cytochrome c-type biogenesis protein
MSLVLAFSAGIVSFLSPCVLPIVPGYVSYVAGESAHRGRLTTLGLSAMFVGGFAAVFIAFGASASLIGQLLLHYRYEVNLGAGAVIVVFGLMMLGALRWVPWLARDLRPRPRLQGGNALAAFVLGLAFAFGWTPCIGPVLGAILTVSAAGTSTDGIGLLSAYAAGLGVPFLATALFIERARRITGGLRRFGAALQRAGGLLMVLLGLAIMNDRLTGLSLWLFERFPLLRTIG